MHHHHHHHHTRHLVAVVLLLLSSLCSLATALYLPTHDRLDHLPSSSSTTSRRSDDAAGSDNAASDRLVFCHFMMGIVGGRTASTDYDADMIRARDAGIDAFALNIGVDSFTDTQLQYAYKSAASNNFKVFISFDFNWFTTSDAATVGQMIAKYGALDGQLKVDGKIMASSFAGDGVDVAAIRAAAGVDVFWAPNFHPGQGTDLSVLDGALNWVAWPSNGANKAPNAAGNVSVSAGDDAYIAALTSSQDYIAPVSPWFSTHYGPEVSYSKNWVFPGDLLWFERWSEVLALKPRFVEIITWNDYGESHYIGPLSSPHNDDGNSKWVNDMPHNGWLDMAVPFISAYHDGADSPDAYVTDDKLVYWYRPTLAGIDCDATDTTMVEASNTSGNYFMGRPDGYQTLADAVFVVSLLKEPATITVVSGDGSAPVTWDAPAGVSAGKPVPMAVGPQSFSVARDGQAVMSAVSLRDISDVCPCGLYNFNAYVGTVPEGETDQLQSLGLASLTAGLHVSTCLPTPSLGAAPATSPASPASPVTSIATSYATSHDQETATEGYGSGSTTTGQQTTGAPVSYSTSAPASDSTSRLQSSSPSTTQAKSTPSTSPSLTPSSGGDDKNTCNAGTAAGNYQGLCQFSCQYGYCPAEVCTCTSHGTPAIAPASEGVKGSPLAGEDASYLGLCAFACDKGYCPETACEIV